MISISRLDGEESFDRMCKRLKDDDPLQFPDHEVNLHDQKLLEDEILALIGPRSPRTVILTLASIVGLVAGASAEGRDVALWDNLSWARMVMEQASICVHKELRASRITDPFKHEPSNPVRRKSNG